MPQFADNAFAGVTVLKTAHLENNRLTHLPRNFPFDKMETLTISRNPWHCNCQLAPLRKYGTVTPRCGLPCVPRAVSAPCCHTQQLSPHPALSCPWFVPFSSSSRPCSLCHRWLKGNRTRAEDTCSTPAQHRGQPIRDTPALRTCKLPTKRSRKGSRH